MKETKFNDVTGFSEKNTLYQFDQWETQTLRGAKNRYIYDFSFPVFYGEEDDFLLNFENDAGNKPYQDKILTNLAPSPSLGIYGTPGGKAEYIGSLSTERTVNENQASISVNEDTLMFTNKAFSTTLGSTQLADEVNYFRSGYAEFTIKTTKQNCIIASGSSEVDAADLNAIFWLFGSAMDQGASISALSTGDTMSPKHLISEDHPYYRADSFDGAIINLNIIIKDGKLAIEYYDDYNRDNVNFLFIGNDTVADGNWHHVVVNFGRPGLIKTNGTKFNKKFVEIWLDGKLDKRFDDKVNEYQIFYPTIKWLFNNPKEIVYNYLENEIDIENNLDVRGSVISSGLSNPSTSRYIGINEISSDGDLFNLSVNSDFYKVNAFKGAIHTFAHGLNIPISQYEIKKRALLWRNQTQKSVKAYKVNALMVNPAVSTNSKKAIRLFWNNIIETGKFGLELDKSLQVETYSITHKIDGSSTETLNYDIKENKKEVNVLSDVRVVLTDNVLVNGPGAVYFANTEEGYAGLSSRGASAGPLQTHPKARGYDSVSATDLSAFKRFVGPRTDLTFSGILLNDGDRILLTNQIKTEENGIWIYNGLNDYLSRATDSLVSDETKINVVYITDGYDAGSYWRLAKPVTSLIDPQKWTRLNLSKIENFFADFELSTRWKDYRGEDRFIDVNSDLDLSKYDVITFVNYPETNDEIFEIFPNDSRAEILNKYSEFLNNLRIAASNGANLFISSPKLAEDLGIVKSFTKISQRAELSDERSAVSNPFQFGEPKERYFDTHRINAYHVDTPVAGLTNRETWLMTDFINYLPEDEYDYEQWHAKYSYRQFGLQEGNEFIIPSLALRSATENTSLPGFRSNYRGTSDLYVAKPSDVLAGTIVTSLANNYYSGSTVTVNPFEDYATTIIVHNGQQLKGMPINGKIFVNCVEDSYTMSREEYNKAIIQVIPNNEINETLARRAWQYSTSRLNRQPRRINVKELTAFGQTTPTNGGGGPVIQATSNSSTGIIRSQTDSGNINYESDLYPVENEEIYQTQEIPVLSMTWLGLKWLTA